MSSFQVPQEARDAQRRASHPELSAWVAANAGSGKTFVLVRRVVRLLLAGTPPGAILCLTFTKAAAATMANRVFDLLRKWVRMEDEALAAELEDIEGARPSADHIIRARRLFAEALETPGGLKIQTIHAFCERLLHQFPFEANVPARFEVLDEAGSRELAENARRAALEEASRDRMGPLGRALSLLSARAGDSTLADLFASAMGQGEALSALQGLSEDAMRARLSAALGVDPSDSLAGIEDEIVADAVIKPSEWASVGAEILHLQQGQADQDMGSGLVACARVPKTHTDDYLRLFLTLSDTVRKTLVTKKAAAALGPIPDWLLQEALRLEALVQRRKGVIVRELSLAVQLLGLAMFAHVEAAKARRGLLDFSDLITLTVKLFDRVPARWVLYKLDAAIDHILVDEAQDTSPAQWDIVQRFVEEFTAGEGARPIPRTLFVVGDEKQSIYSFQGADPKRFEEMRQSFQQRFRVAGLPFETIRLLYSFRSTDAVLNSVDQIFTPPAHARGLVAEGGRPEHKAARISAPGLVEVWPVIEGEAAPPFEPYRLEMDAIRPGNPRLVLAQRLASEIKSWIGQKRLPASDKPIRAGDVLILVRQRGPLFQAVIRALKSFGVPVAGADRLVLTDHIAVQDLMALGDVLLCPQDDHALACLLSSPLFGLDDEALFPLCYRRPGSLWEELARQKPDIHARLTHWAERLNETTPGQLYAEVLARDGGRVAFLKRLGSEAGDALDEFLSLALTHEQKHGPDLFGFLAALRRQGAEIKRDMDASRDEVRVMTVHGAKGLEAPIVILADTMGAPTEAKRPKLMHLAASPTEKSQSPHLVYLPSKDLAVPALDDTRTNWLEAQLDEHRRLLYVALTRAEDMLVICGAGRASQSHWHGMVSEALATTLEEVPRGEGEPPLLRHGTPLISIAAEDREPEVKPALPDWVTRPAPAPAVRQRSLAPSLALDERAEGAPSAVLARQQALKRGTLTHRLLQSLPDLPQGRREEAARKFLAQQQGLDDALVTGILADTLALLDLPLMQRLLAPSSRAEVSLAGMVAGRPVNGQIDRLVREKDRLIIADYKTNDPPPSRLDEVPQAYLTQMALYRTLLLQAAPGLAVEVVLVFTANANVIPLPEALLDEALALHLSRKAS